MTQQKMIRFMAWRNLATAFSAVLVVGSLLSLATRGLVLGLDFTGGAQIEVGYQHSVTTSYVREQLRAAGFDNPVVVHFGADTDILVRLQEPPRDGNEKAATEQAGQRDQPVDNNLGERIAEVLRRSGDEVELRRVEFVGPQIGAELRDDGGLGMLLALFAVMLYVAIRFQYKFAIGAVVALFHDVIITLGFFSFFRFEFDLTVLAAVLAVIGYSINDTIVVFDRIRENFRLMRKAGPVEVFDESITQTLERTLITGVTTLIVLIALFLIGGELIHNFSIALIVGIVIGTYSSIYIASSMVLTTGITRENLLPTEKEGPEFDGLP